MASTASGWQYAVPNDTLVAWPAVSQAVADKLQTDLPRPAGLQFIKRQTVGTSVTSVNVTSAFNSTYDNYRILLKGISTDNANSFKLMLGTGATSGHYGASFYYQFNGAQTGYLTSNNAGSVYLTLNSVGTSAHISFDVLRPNEAAFTGITGTGWGRSHASWFGGAVENTTQYTSFTILTDGAGTMSNGTIDVYGYAK